MVNGDIRSQIDRIWDAFWSGGISNPLEVIEQITYLLPVMRKGEHGVRVPELPCAAGFQRAGNRREKAQDREASDRPRIYRLPQRAVQI